MKKEKKIIILLIIIIMLLTAGIGLLLLTNKSCNCESATSYPVSTLNVNSDQTSNLTTSTSLKVAPVPTVTVSYPVKGAKLITAECDSTENMLQSESLALCYPKNATATKLPESSSVEVINLEGGSQNPEFIIESIPSNLSKGFHNNGNNEYADSIDSLINFFKGLYRNSEVTSEYIQGYYYRGFPAFRFNINSDRVFTFTSESKLTNKEDKELIIIADLNKKNMILIFRTVNAVTDAMIDSLELN